jgi:two-component system, OmpR family, sensor histidine kinase KdpD
MPGAPVYIRADTYFLNTTLDNILDNAIRHAPAGTAVEVSASERAGQLLIQIADRGPGIPAGEEERLFERFYRGSGERPGGLGLGLAIARQFVELMGGSVSAERRSGGGASFTVALPCTTELPLSVETNA